MSTERKPLLTGLDWYACVNNPDDPREVRTAEAIVDFYENLITTGKLRVVEEVTLVDGCCPVCDTFMAMPLDVVGNDLTPPYCSGCGNKIKRA